MRLTRISMTAAWQICAKRRLEWGMQVAIRLQMRPLHGLVSRLLVHSQASRDHSAGPSLPMRTRDINIAAHARWVIATTILLWGEAMEIRCVIPTERRRDNDDSAGAKDSPVSPTADVNTIVPS